jgi:glycosyltransferase involved in cell wall biosynthesis
MSVARPVVLLLPTRDEAATVGAIVRRAPRDVRHHPVVVLVVDDGSTDHSAAEAQAAGAHVVSQPPRGLGAAVRTGLRQALAFDPVAVAFCDADGEYAPEELECLVAPILDGEADYVIGSRFAGTIETMHAHRRFGNRVLTAVVAVLARRMVTDGQSGYRALSSTAADCAEVIHDYNYAQVLTLDLVRKGFRYTEVPISYSFRTEGRSFVKLLPYLRHVVPGVWRELRSSHRTDAAEPRTAQRGSPGDGSPISIGGFGRGEDRDVPRGAGEGRGEARPEQAAAAAGHSGAAKLRA